MSERIIKSIAITGPTGAIGMALIQECLQRNIRLVLITHGESKRNKYIPDSELITVLCTDISGYDQVETNNLKVDAFIHLAWMKTVGDGRNDVDAQLKNVEYTMAAVRLASRMSAKVFLGAGSQAEYGRVEGYLRPDTPVFPENGYGMAKLCAGQMSRLLCLKLGIEHIWTRILSIYGPYDGCNTMIVSALKRFIAKEETAFTPGEQEWDYLYCRDAAKMLIAALNSGVNGKVYCIGSGIHKPLKDYIHDIHIVACGKDASDEELGIGKVAYGDKQVMMLCADLTENEKDFGVIELTPFKEGICNTVEWLKAVVVNE